MYIFDKCTFTFTSFVVYRCVPQMRMIASVVPVLMADVQMASIDTPVLVVPVGLGEIAMLVSNKSDVADLGFILYTHPILIGQYNNTVINPGSR